MRPGFDRPLRVITLCSGYDSQCMALERLKEAFPGFGYELVAWSEIDRHAIQAHDAVFPQWAGRNLGDMTRIDWSQVEGDIDLLVYSTPCTSISTAGKQEGLKKGSGTASSILWATEAAIKTLRPRWLLMDVSDGDIDRIQASDVSRSQQYRMAGNSIVVSVLFHIFRKMFVDTGSDNNELELF